MKKKTLAFIQMKKQANLSNSLNSIKFNLIYLNTDFISKGTIFGFVRNNNIAIEKMFITAISFISLFQYTSIFHKILEQHLIFVFH